MAEAMLEGTRIVVGTTVFWQTNAWWYSIPETQANAPVDRWTRVHPLEVPLLDRVAWLEASRDREVLAEKERYMHLCTGIIEATGVEVPIGGITAEAAVADLKRERDALLEKDYASNRRGWQWYVALRAAVGRPVAEGANACNTDEISALIAEVDEAMRTAVANAWGSAMDAAHDAIHDAVTPIDECERVKQAVQRSLTLARETET